MAKLSFKKVDVHLGEAVNVGLSELIDLAREMRDWADNMDSGGLGHTNKFVEVDGAAHELENVPDEITVPFYLDDLLLQVRLGEKRHNPRWLRRDNAVAHLEAAKEEAHGTLSDLEAEIYTAELEDFDGDEDELEAHTSAMEADADELREFIDEIENAISYAEAVEFPGMFG